MPGINLSHSAEQASELKRSHSFGRGAVSVIGIFALALAVWGGVSFYEKKLVAEVDAVAAEIVSKKGAFSGADVDDVADFQFRLEILESELNGLVVPASMLGSIEGLLLPGVVLTEYAFDAATKSITLIGKTDSFGTIARQMVLIKRMPDFSGLSVKSLSRDKDGVIRFDFSVALSR
jgi:hypothetical protein